MSRESDYDFERRFRLSLPHKRDQMRVARLTGATNGPWAADQSGDIYSVETGHGIGEAWHGESNWEANARIMAAAPSLIGAIGWYEEAVRTDGLTSRGAAVAYERLCAVYENCKATQP